jgi:NhaA family Na+:H+ antiporter
MEQPRRWDLTFLGSRRALARYVGRPLARFVDVEASGGIVLLVAAAVALVWANSPWQDGYHDLWHTEIRFEVGSYRFEDTLLHLINDGLMAVFFFVVGLEIKREFVVGELRDRRRAAVPVVAALGGMVVPAALYLALNLGSDGVDGWAIPMATDIAFALGVVALLGSRVPSSLKVFLLTLAIVDDIGAIVVIAVAYTDDLSFPWLALAGGGLGLMAIMRRARVWALPLYVAVGVGVWLATYESGVHATIAGVAMGLLAPARPLQDEIEAEEIVDRLNPIRDVSAGEVREVSFLIRESVSVAERLEEVLHPYSSYLIVPLFALANAGLSLSGDELGEAATSAVTVGVVLGLVLGKPLGIALATWLATRAGWGTLAPGVRPGQVVGIGAVAGIGFTVSLFVTNLAFGEAGLAADAKVGILVASVLAAGLGGLLLARHS